MKIKALKTLKFNPTGFGKTITIEAGEEGECPDHLAAGYIKAKAASEMNAEPAKPKKQTKPDDGAKGKAKESKPLEGFETK